MKLKHINSRQVFEFNVPIHYKHNGIYGYLVLIDHKIYFMHNEDNRVGYIIITEEFKDLSYKLIKVDAFDRETVSDILIEENLSFNDATYKANALNIKEEEDEGYNWFYRAVLEDYKLFIVEY